MGLSINIRAGAIQHTANLDLSELEAMRADAANIESLKEAMETVFPSQEFSESKDVRLGDFLDGIDILLHEAESVANALIYYLYGSPVPGLVPKGGASGIGVMIEGHRCFLMGGINECTLTKYGLDKNGEWKPMSVEDIRHSKVISTDDQGEIEIRKKNKTSNTMRSLRRIKDFLKNVPRETRITVSIA